VNVVVLGAGALGSLYGAWCADAGHDVVLVGRPPHVEAVRRAGGLVVRDHRGGSRHVTLDAAVDAGDVGDADVVLVACKAQDTVPLLAAFGGAPQAVWSVQNGARQSVPLVGRFGAAAIGCVSMVGATLDAPAVVTNTFSGTTYVGPLPTSAPAATDIVVDSLLAVAVERRDDIEDVLWSKAVLATGAMGMSILLRLPYHHVFTEPPARRVFYDLVAEAATVATAAGARLVDLPGPLQAGSLMALPRDDALEALARLGRDMVARGQTATRVSMLQSLETGRRLEVDAVFADVVAVADEHGLEVPLLRAVTDVARALDDVAARGSGR
jgi:2-dehydropantoate 2-reductase